MSASFDHVLQYFREICAIPHGSYHIDEISDYLVSFAKNHSLAYRQDELKNVIIFKEASAGYENEPALILQGHMDMVAVSDDPEKDMEKEGPKPVEEDGYLFSPNTSLGGDDGIAVAYALAILEADDLPHPALEAVFTVNEEVGMDGAVGIDLSDCKGKRLLNIDSEEEGVITVSCAGGIRLHAEFEGKTEKLTAPCVFLSLDGLLGGHSGAEIHKGRANAAHLMADILLEIAEEYDVYLISMAAGEKDNAIPSSAGAEFLVTDLGDADEFIGFAEHINEHFKARYEGIEENISFTAGIQLPREEECFTYDDTERFLEYLVEAPDGVISMCEDIDMVQTSLNLGILKCTTDGMSADFALRSSVKEEKAELIKRLRSITETYGGEVSTSGDYPAWEYVKDSPFRDQVVRVYKECYKEDPVVTGIHAGLECGILSTKIPGLEAVSIGPNILDIHTTKEKLDIKSAKRTWEYILKLLSEKQA